MNTSQITQHYRQRATARQYEIDAERASELALHGMIIFEPARDLAKQFQEMAIDALQL